MSARSILTNLQNFFDTLCKYYPKHCFHFFCTHSYLLCAASNVFCRKIYLFHIVATIIILKHSSPGLSYLTHPMIMNLTGRHAGQIEKSNAFRRLAKGAFRGRRQSKYYAVKRLFDTHILFDHIKWTEKKFHRSLYITIALYIIVCCVYNTIMYCKDDY